MNSQNTDEYVKGLERELIGLQEMIAFLLHTIGEPVVVSKEMVSAGLPANATIQIDDDAQRNAFVFSITEGSNDSN